MPGVPLPIDSDVDLHEARQRAELRRPVPVLAVIAAGAALGTAARYGLGVARPYGPPAFPWTTFAINASGCLLIGVLMVLVVQVFPGRPLLRPFLGVGVLGGYTTFSTYVVEASDLVRAGAVGTAVVYLLGTVAVAVPAGWLGLVAARHAVVLLRRRRRAPGVRA